MNNRKKLLVGAFVGVLSVLGVIFGLIDHGAASFGGERSFAGSIEAPEVKVSFKISGKISQLLVEEGEEVKEGQILARLENKELTAQWRQAEAAYQAAQTRLPQAKTALNLQEAQSESQIAQAQSLVKAAEAKLQALLKGARPQEIAQAEAGVKSAESALKNAEAAYRRMEFLYQAGAVAQQQYDTAKFAYEGAQAQLQAAREKLALAKEGARAEEIDGARAQVEQAKAALELALQSQQQEVLRAEEVKAAEAQGKQAQAALAAAEAMVSNTLLKAPVGGTVTLKNAEEGEIVTAGYPVVIIANLAKPYLKVFVPEDFLGSLRTGQQIEVKVPALAGKKVVGKVAAISVMPDFATRKATNELAERDIRSFAVKIDLENPDLVLKPGMTGEIQLKAKVD